MNYEECIQSMPIKRDIANGLYRPGEFLPNELELAKKYAYARNTVRPALAMLEAGASRLGTSAGVVIVTGHATAIGGY